MASLVYRHNPVTRLTHWLNAIALTILFMSGLQIFNAYPRLHWGSKAEPQEAFFSIAATRYDGEVRGSIDILGRKFDTTGVLGVQNTPTGPSRRAFPSWITIPGYFWLAGGRRWHFFFAWFFVLNGMLYLIFNVFNGHVRKFLVTPRDAAAAPAMVLYYLRLRRSSPQTGEYNPLQKIAYSSVFLILTPLLLLSGLAMSPQFDVAFNWLPAAFGGRQSARSIHFFLAFFFVFFTFGHVLMVLATGFLNNMRSMLTGWYSEKVPSQTMVPPPEPRPAPATEEAPLNAPQQPTDEIRSSSAAESSGEASAKADAAQEQPSSAAAIETSLVNKKETDKDAEE
jgi:thiosulfate reductase cytochrome b subunit